MEIFNFYEGILEGLREAVAFHNGELKEAKISVRDVPTVVTLPPNQKPTAEELREFQRVETPDRTGAQKPPVREIPASPGR